MEGFKNPNLQEIYDSNGKKHTKILNNGKDLEGEIWYELDNELKGVYLSNFGRYYTQKVIKSYGNIHENRYVFYKRFNDGIEKRFNVDTQLLIKLVGSRPTSNHEVYHIDGNNLNNNINNLQWIDKKEKDTSLIENKTKSMIIFQIEKNKIVNIYDSATDANKKTSINLGQLSDCAKGKRKSAGGFQWLYRKDLYDPDLEDEEWKKHPSLDLMVSNMGRIILQNGKTQGEYDTTKNSYKSSTLKNYVHVLIAETFIEESKEGREVDHINGNCNDNRIYNLRYATRSEQVLNRGHKYDKNYSNTDIIKIEVEKLYKDKNIEFYQNILNNILKNNDLTDYKLEKNNSKLVINNDKETTIEKNSNSSKIIYVYEKNSNSSSSSNDEYIIVKQFGSRKECAEFYKKAETTIGNYIKSGKLLDKKYFIKY